MKNQRGDAELAIMIVLGVVILGVCIGIGWVFEAYQCGKRSEMMGLQSSWGPVQRCMVKVGPRYAPIGYIRIVDEKVVIQGDGE